MLLLLRCALVGMVGGAVIVLCCIVLYCIAFISLHCVANINTDALSVGGSSVKHMPLFGRIDKIKSMFTEISVVVPGTFTNYTNDDDADSNNLNDDNNNNDNARYINIHIHFTSLHVFIVQQNGTDTIKHQEQ